MQLTRREGSKSGRFSVSVNSRQGDKIEDMLTYLEEKTGKAYSQVVVELIIEAAERAGWSPPTDEGSGSGG